MSRPVVLTALGALLAATPATAALSATLGSDAPTRAPALKPLAALAAPTARVAPAPHPSQHRYEILRVKRGHSVALRTSPGGPIVARIDATTEFGSPQALAVAAAHGGWLGVTTTDRPNGTLGWVRAASLSVTMRMTPVSIYVSLSRRLLELRVGARVVRRVRIGIGRPGSPTPTGRFAITDKLNGPDYGAFYGCCILALSGHQTSTPAGWQGGNRLAIHGTDEPATIGAAASAGCLHAADADLRFLMRRVPLGTPVFIHR